MPDKPTHRRVMAVGLLFCVAFVAIGFRCGRSRTIVVCW
jgi:hypothetical protein